MPEEFIENKIVSFLIDKDFRVQSGSDFPSTIDIVASKDDQLILFELKESGQIDTSDIMRIKSLERLWSDRLETDKRKSKSFVLTKHDIPEVMKGLIGEFRIETYRFDQIGSIFSHRVFQER